MNIAENLQRLTNALPDNVTLVAVSKLKPVEDILAAYKAGHRDFGENRVDEFIEKAGQLPDDIRWHFIGHLQTKKVKKVVPYAHIIHSVDSVKLLEEINKRAEQNSRITDCLLQVHIAQEDTKSGFSFQDVREVITSGIIKNNQHIRVVGLMGMATFTTDTTLIRNEFKTLAGLYDSLKEFHDLQILSMGMSGDYTIAIEEGSNLIRVGSAIFGARN